MTAEAEQGNEPKRDDYVSPRAARAGQRHARSQEKRDQQRGEETQRIPRMEKSDGNHRAAEIIREIVGLVDRAEHRVDRLYGYVSAGGGQRNVIVLNESARSGEQARCTDPPLQRTRNCSFSELAAQPGAQYCEQACPYRIERTGRAAQGVGHLPEGGLQDEQTREEEEPGADCRYRHRGARRSDCDRRKRSEPDREGEPLRVESEQGVGVVGVQEGSRNQQPAQDEAQAHKKWNARSVRHNGPTVRIRAWPRRQTRQTRQDGLAPSVRGAADDRAAYSDTSSRAGKKPSPRLRARPSSSAEPPAGKRRPESARSEGHRC